MARLCLGGPKDGQHVDTVHGSRLMIAGDQPGQWTDYNLRTIRVNGDAWEVWILEGMHAEQIRTRIADFLGAPAEIEWVA